MLRRSEISRVLNGLNLAHKSRVRQLLLTVRARSLFAKGTSIDFPGCIFECVDVFWIVFLPNFPIVSAVFVRFD